MHFSKYFNKNNEYIIFFHLQFTKLSRKRKKKKKFFPRKSVENDTKPNSKSKKKIPKSSCIFLATKRAASSIFIFNF